MRLRAEGELDRKAVRRVLEAAFPTAAEASLVDALRAASEDVVLWVACLDGEVVGHIAFSPVQLHPTRGTARRVYGLAPMAVLPEHQGRGVGSALVEAGLAQCRALGVDAVVVLGHPAYYPRFGFVAASRFLVRSEYDAPDEAFLALELKPGVLSQPTSDASPTWTTVRYDAAFAAL